MKRLLKFRTSYASQILMYDFSNLEDTITLDYGEVAYSRGYAQTEGAIAFFPIIEDGITDISVWEGRHESNAVFDNIVEAPICLRTGDLCIHEPENEPVILSVKPGNYVATITQSRTKVADFVEINISLVRVE